MNLKDKLMFAFDLDDTLAPSKSPLDPAMAQTLRRLLDKRQVAVISGGTYEQFEGQLLQNLHLTPAQAANLHLLPTCGTCYLLFGDDQWRYLYRRGLSDEQRRNVSDILEQEARNLGLWEEDPWGPIIEDRFSQVTFSALGQSAPLEAKRSWDPDGSKKNALVEAVSGLVPDLAVRGGGSTSVDVTEKGIDKAYGMEQLLEQTGISKDKVVFFGDRLDVCGNDYPVKAAGFDTVAVEGWEDTRAKLESVLDSLD